MKRSAATGCSLGAAVAWLLTFAAPATAHPIDELLQQIYVTPAANHATIELELTPGVLVGSAFTALVDSDQDGTITETESQVHARGVASAMTVTVDGSPARLDIGDVIHPDPAMLAAGGGTVKISLTAHFTGAPRHVLVVTDHYHPVPTGVQVSVTQAYDHPLSDVEIAHADSGRIMTVTFSTPTNAADKTPPTTTAQPEPPYLLAALRQPLSSPFALAYLLLASTAIGALHALTPGHGKTLLAAYLVAERATPGQAVKLAGAVTFAHTASVIAIGVGLLVAGHYAFPETLVPAIQFVAGAAVVMLGARLVLRRWDGRHPHGCHVHVHHGIPHHQPAATDDHHDAHPASPTSTITMAVSGGVVPCPEALGVMLLAVAVHRTALGMAMIVAFSAGLAMVLVGLGLIMINPRFGRRLRTSSARIGAWARWIPLVSAVLVVCLGFGLLLRGVAALA